jgi:hypothetical protein
MKVKKIENTNSLNPPCLSYGTDISCPKISILSFKNPFFFIISLPIFFSMKEV